MQQHGDRGQREHAGEREDAGHADERRERGRRRRARARRWRRSSCRWRPSRAMRTESRVRSAVSAMHGGGDGAGALEAAARRSSRRSSGAHAATKLPSAKMRRPADDDGLASPAVGCPAERNLQQRLREAIGAERDPDSVWSRPPGSVSAYSANTGRMMNMPSIRSPKMLARPPWRDARRASCVAAASAATARGARSCGMGLTMGRGSGARERRAESDMLTGSRGHLRNACGMAV